MFEQAAVGIAVASLSDRILRSNPAFCSLLGYDEPELVGASFMQLSHPEDAQTVSSSLCQLVSGETAQLVMNTRYLRKSGDAIRAETRMALVADASGVPTRVVAVVQDTGAQRQTQEALRESEDRYRRLIETARELIVTVDAEGRLTSLNGAFETLTGWARGEWIGRSFTELIHPDDLAACLSVFEAARRGEAPPVVSHRLATRRGEWLRLESTGTPVYRDGRLTGVLGVARDVTAHVRAEHALDESRGRLQALFDNALDAILLIDDAGHYLDANAAATDLLGYSREELLRMSADDVMPAEERERLPAIRREFSLKGSYSGAFRLRRRDGEVRDTEFRSVANIQPGVHLAMVRDVTQSRRAQLEIARRERLFEEAERAAHVGCWEWDLQSGNLSWSSETYRIFGVADADFVPTYAGFLELVHVDDRRRVYEANGRAVHQGGQFSIRFRVQRPNDDLRFLHSHGRSVVARDGSVTRIVGIVQDVTEHHRNEQLRHELVSRLLAAHEEERARLSRDLHDGAGQSLTAALLGLTRIQQAKTVREAKALAARQRALLSSIIEDVSRLAQGLRPAALEESGLKGALERYGVEGSRLFDLDVEVRAGRIGRLPGEVETALYRTAQEATSNAARHGGAHKVQIVLTRSRDAVRLKVSDDGSGFVASRARRGYRHLGLSGISERASLLGGAAEIQSIPGRGTTVVVSLPLRAASQPVPRRTPRARPGGGKRARR